jgi:uncharacterized membrane protein
MTQNSSAPAPDDFKESMSDKVKGFIWANGMYVVLAGIAVTAFLMFGMTALAVTVIGLVFIAVSFFVGSMSESVKRGLITGAVATLPVALFFMWILK